MVCTAMHCTAQHCTALHTQITQLPPEAKAAAEKAQASKWELIHTLTSIRDDIPSDEADINNMNISPAVMGLLPF
jgi:hypothetical protein